MKHLFIFMAVLCIAISGVAKPVSQAEAEQIAIAFYTHNAPVSITDYTVEKVFVTRYDGETTFYTFIFRAGGFVLVAADDASIPVLGYSFENGMPEEITNPATKYWLDGYNREIHEIVREGLSNSETLRQWEAIRAGNFPMPTRDVNPLLSTIWDQGCYYNELCPADPGGPCGHVWTGCVATAMAQVMKYHNFPPQGVGSHTYTSGTYGQQTANFGNTTYNWAAMPNSVGSSNIPTATIMYHAGVSVDMQYSTSGSGAYSDDVPDAFLDYFNYHPDVTIKYKADYPNMNDWKVLLRADLDNQLPIYYSGYGSGGHAFVCDGYRLSDDKFHFNWGWSGSSNGWYAIGALNPGGNNFNLDNAPVVHVKPYNPNLIVRITHPVNYAVIGVGYSVDIEATTVRGTPNLMKIFIDNNEMASGTGTTLNYAWNTTPADLGSHEVRAYSYTATDTVYYKIILNVAEWISQASGFQSIIRGINYMWAVDTNIVWAAAYDVSNPTGACQDFTRTLDGGTTWTPGIINDCQGLASSMIFGMDADKAWVPMYWASGNKPQGIYATTDGGAAWTRQTSASYSNAASFPNTVHFFNETEGWCMGDPINGEYEIYTTTNGGTTWVAVPGANIPNPVSGEFGIVGYYSAVNDTLWFGTNKGRVYKSTDKGYTYTVSTVPALNGKYIKPTFRTGMHGLVQDKDLGSTGTICETFDGGTTWTLVSATGPIYPTDLAYVPNTENTWVSTGGWGNNGSSYSFDGGHTWADFLGTQGSEYMNMTWINNHCGWAGGVNASATENGVYKYIGLLLPPLPAPTNLQADVINYDVHLTWEAPVSDAPAFTLLGYNMYRDGLRLNASPIPDLFYDDHLDLPGEYTYCVKAVYDIGESNSDCITVEVAVSLDEQKSTTLTVSPNPAHIMIVVRAATPIDEIRIFDIRGKEVYRKSGLSNQMTIDVSKLASGYYTLTAISGKKIKTAKVIIQ
ncbi:MAG: C10 family peptidase [bacterium]